MELNKSINDKVLILGIDGMDPRFTVRMLKQNRMPHLQKFLDRGSAREDLVMLGAHPTGTPPMWTTLTTGAYSYTHGITCFNLDSPKGLDYFSYAFDSRRCEAEPLWNVTAEAGKKTLVFHWPGSSWPPTSDNPNLHVVDGTQPSGVNMGTGLVEPEYFIIADKNIPEVRYKTRGQVEGTAPCAINDMDVAESLHDSTGLPSPDNPDVHCVIVTSEQGVDGFIKNSETIESQSPIKPAQGWAKELPEDTLEFTMLFSGGLTRRVALIFKNENGVYDRIEMYKNKKELEPIAVLPYDVYVPNIIDETLKGGKAYKTNKSFRVIELAEDGSYVKIYVSDAMNIEDDLFYSPRSLYQQCIDAAGYVPAAPMTYAHSKKVAIGCMGAQWDLVCEWQSKAMHALIEQNGYEVVFSHCHNVDAQAHMLIRHMKERDYSLVKPEEALEAMERVYEQTDEYLATFEHFLDEGWNVFIISDHGLVCPEYERPGCSEANGISVELMRHLGFTEVLKDADGNDLREIDWSKTKAVSSRANQIYLNLKGKYDHGIVEPEDQWEVEEEIITALYNYKHPISGKRVIELAIRNKDAYLLGMGGEHCGDILYWTADHYNDDHFDGLATCYGMNDTSLSPIFIAAGPGIKEGYKTKRVIREVDFVPTVATILGVRMPEDCEGALIYQILE